MTERQAAGTAAGISDQASFLDSASDLIRRAAVLAADPRASDDERVADGIFFLGVVSGVVAGSLWGIVYLLLGRPVSAAVPGGFGLFSAGLLVWLLRKRRAGRTRELWLLGMLLLPAVVQATLGGYVKGSAVIMWAFWAPMEDLVLFGPRRALPWLAGFVALTIGSALFEQPLAAAVPALPAAAQTALFAFNLTGLASLTILVLAYFRSERDEAKARSDQLLLNVLPPEIAERLKRHEHPIADRFDEVTVLFADMVGFTQHSASQPPEVTVAVLNEFLTAFDRLAERHDLQPIRTTGDSYLVVGGLPVPRPDHAQAVAQMALDMLSAVHSLNAAQGWDYSFRIGVNTGPTMAAVVGVRRFTYDVWSDTVNTASRMESCGVPGRIQVTEETRRRLRDEFQFEARPEMDVKGKGRLQTYFLTGRRAAAQPLLSRAG